MGKAISQLRKRPPDFIVTEFFYGYGNNYAGVNLSNLDVMLSSLPKYAPLTRQFTFGPVPNHTLQALGLTMPQT